MKKNCLKLAGLLSAFLLAVSFAGCQQKEPSKEPVADGAEAESVVTDTVEFEEPLKIGVIQLVEHQSLDDIYRGIVDQLKEDGYEDGKNIIIDYQNGQNDPSNLKTISQRFVNNKSDLVIAIATGAAQSIASETSTIPIIASSVTDLVNAELAESNDAPGGNVTGVSDMTPVKEQIDILLQIAPETKKIGIAYCSSEINSELQANIAKTYIEGLGLQPEVSTITNVNDITQCLDVLTSKVDALYIPVDNTFASAMPTVRSVCASKKLPLAVGAAAMVEEGALASVAFDYYDAGKQSAKMAVRVLQGADPAAMPVETVTETHVYLNKTYAEEIGLSLPDDLVQSAAEVY